LEIRGRIERHGLWFAAIGRTYPLASRIIFIL